MKNKENLIVIQVKKENRNRPIRWLRSSREQRRLWNINSILNIEKDKVEKNDRVDPWKKGIYKEGQNGHCSIGKPIYILRTQLDKSED